MKLLNIIGIAKQIAGGRTIIFMQISVSAFRDDILGVFKSKLNL